MREKLIKLLKNSLRESGEYCGENPCRKCQYDKYGDDCGYAIRADYFIANGVTFAEDNNVPSKWIPVTERLPDDDSNVLANLRIGEEGRIYPAYYAKGVWWDCIFNTPATKTTTHWMPLPTPPKGE